MITVLFANIKGGVAKTTDCTMISSSLKRRGYRVLVVDGDPQGGLTECAGLVPVKKNETYPDGLDWELMDVYDGKCSMKDAIIHTEIGDVVPNTFNLFMADKKYIGPNTFTMLKDSLATVENDYDFCFIDALPGAGVNLYNCLIASDYVIIPILAAKSSVRGIQFLSECISEVQARLNPSLKVLGFAVNRYNKMTKFGRNILEEIEQIVQAVFGAGIFKTKIRNGVVIDECEYEGKSVYAYRQDSNVAKDFEELTTEVLAALGMNPIAQ